MTEQKNNSDPEKAKQNILRKYISRIYAVQYCHAKKMDTSINIDVFLDFISAENSNDEDNVYPAEPNLEYLHSLNSALKKYQSQAAEKIVSVIVRDIEAHPALILAILEVAFCEALYFQNNIPRKVIINEYTNITSEFFDENEVGFVNAVLDKIL